MSIAVHPGEVDLYLPRPARGEAMHPYTVHTHYFGFAVPSAQIGAYIYLRCQPHFGLSQGGPSIYRGLDNDALLDADYHDYRTTMPWPEVDGNVIRVPNGLVIEAVEPGALLRVRYSSPDGSTSFDLEQRAITPMLARGHVLPGEQDHNGSTNHRPGGMEQFMHVTGELVLHGERHDVDCRYFRDRSWMQVRGEEPGGVRKHPPLCWTPMCFGADLAVNVGSAEAEDTNPAWLGLYDLSGDTTIQPSSLVRDGSGVVIRDGEARQAVGVRRTVLERHPTQYAALRQELEVTDETGERYRFTGEAIAMSAMYSWPNLAFHESVYRWTDERGRVTHCTCQEVWYDDYQHAMRRR